MSKKFVFYVASCPLLLAILSCAIWFGSETSAKTNNCAVSMDVKLNGSETSIIGATATAVNKETKKSYKSVLEDGMPFFENLPEGEYRVTVTKAGYMRSVNDFTLNCQDFVYDWTIELYKGSSRLSVKLYNRPIPRRDSTKLTMIGDVSSNSGISNSTEKPTILSDDEPVIPIPTPKPVPRTVAGGVVNGKAKNLVTPPYPAEARAERVSGQVQVQVTIDETGKIIFAQAISGHRLLRKVCEEAARASTFNPTLLSGQPVKVTGIIIYNFVP